VTTQAADAKLAELTARIAPGGRYISGQGGAKYQGAEAFAERGIELTYSDFEVSEYDRGPYAFERGLSVIDAAFHVGWEATAAMVQPRA
jgi:hypothetical protein